MSFRRDQASSVSGFATAANSSKAFRTSRWAISAKVAFSASDNSNLPLIWALRMRFSAARYSFVNRSSWSTVPVCQEITRQRFSGSQPNWTQPDYSGDKDDRRAANRIASEFDRYGTNYRDAINDLTRQSSIVLFEGIHGVLDVFGCDDCVAYEDRTGLPATNLHSDRLWHPGVNQITGTRTTQIVNEQFGALGAPIDLPNRSNEAVGGLFAELEDVCPQSRPVHRRLRFPGHGNRSVPNSLCVPPDGGRDTAHRALQRHRASNGSLDLVAASRSDSERSFLPFPDP